MLARPETRRCIECGLPFGAIGFTCYHGDIDEGPAYWSDRGILLLAEMLAGALAPARRQLAGGHAGARSLLDQSLNKRR